MNSVFKLTASKETEAPLPPHIRNSVITIQFEMVEPGKDRKRRVRKGRPKKETGEAAFKTPSEPVQQQPHHADGANEFERMLEFPQLKLIAEGDAGRGQHICKLCNTVFRSAGAADVQLHLVSQHSINVLQYLNLFYRPARWFEACLFRCQEGPCGLNGPEVAYYTTNQDAFRCHIYHNHGHMAMGAYKRKFGYLEYVESFFTCPICAEVIKHERRAVWKHIEKKHESAQLEDVISDYIDHLKTTSIVVPPGASPIIRDGFQSTPKAIAAAPEPVKADCSISPVFGQTSTPAEHGDDDDDDEESSPTCSYVVDNQRFIIRDDPIDEDVRATVASMVDNVSNFFGDDFAASPSSSSFGSIAPVVETPPSTPPPNDAMAFQSPARDSDGDISPKYICVVTDEERDMLAESTGNSSYLSGYPSIEEYLGSNEAARSQVELGLGTPLDPEATNASSEPTTVVLRGLSRSDLQYEIDKAQSTIEEPKTEAKPNGKSKKKTAASQEGEDVKRPRGRPRLSAEEKKRNRILRRKMKQKMKAAAAKAENQADTSSLDETLSNSVDETPKAKNPNAKVLKARALKLELPEHEDLSSSDDAEQQDERENADMSHVNKNAFQENGTGEFSPEKDDAAKVDPAVADPNAQTAKTSGDDVGGFPKTGFKFYRRLRRPRKLTEALPVTVEASDATIAASALFDLSLHCRRNTRMRSKFRQTWEGKKEDDRKVKQGEASDSEEDEKLVTRKAKADEDAEEDVQVEAEAKAPRRRKRKPSPVRCTSSDEEVSVRPKRRSGRPRKDESRSRRSLPQPQEAPPRRKSVRKSQPPPPPQSPSSSSTEQVSMSDVEAEGHSLFMDQEGGDEGGEADFGWLRSGSTYECELCFSKSAEREAHVKHVRSHNMEYDVYVGKFGEKKIEKKHRCRICEEELVATKDTVSAHCEEVHRTSLVVYNRIVTLIDKEKGKISGSNKRKT